MKRIARILGIVTVLVVAVAVALPFLVDANQFRPYLQTKLSSALGREVTLGGLKLSIFSGSVTASDLTIADDPAFSKTPFVRAKTVAIGVDLIPLIISRKLNVTGVAVDAPDIDLIQTPAGDWNFASLGGASKTPPASPAPSPNASSNTSSNTSGSGTDLSVESVKISGGRLTLARTGVKSPPLVLDKVDIQVTGFSSTAAFPFSLAASMAGGGEIKLDGKAGPINAGDAAATPFTASLHVTHLDPVVAGLLDASLGVAGVASLDGDVQSNGSLVTVKGKLTGQQVKLVKGGVPAKPPVELDLNLAHDLKKQSGTVSRAEIHLGKDVAVLTGAYNLQGETPAVNLKLTGNALAVAELAAFLPALDVVLPAGASIDQGTAAVDFTAQGPLDKLVAAGTVGLENTRIANYDLGSKMKVLEALAGIKADPHTQIQTLSANVKNSPAGSEVENINLVVPSIGTITGAGTVSPSHALDFKMHVAVRSMAGNIPFTVQGTSSDPVFRPDVKGLVTEKLKDLTGGNSAAGAAGNLLNGLFGGKKKP